MSLWPKPCQNIDKESIVEFPWSSVNARRLYALSSHRPNMSMCLLIRISKLLFQPSRMSIHQSAWIFCKGLFALQKENTAPNRSSKFKHLKFSENFNFVGTNIVDSILVSLHCLITFMVLGSCIVDKKPILPYSNGINTFDLVPSLVALNKNSNYKCD